jgi:NAD(P)-dependent dehydrogenase (short-subunit alcohol dehydrogenase family)
MDILGRSDGWQQTLDRIPMGRAASDEEVAGLIAFLCRGGRVHDRPVRQHRRRVVMW